MNQVRSNPSAQISSRIESKAAKIAIIGMGYVGLPLAIAFARHGFSVLGVDQDVIRLHKMQQGQSPFTHIPNQDVAEVVKSGRLTFIERDSSDASFVDADVYILCVPTPVKDVPGSSFPIPDMRYVESATQDVACALSHDPLRTRLVILESTTYAGTTRKLMNPVLTQASDKTLVAYSPEREDPGNVNFSTTTIPKLVGGVTPVATAMAAILYRKVIAQVHAVKSVEVAECAKLWENTFRMINIAAVNELRSLCDGVELDVRDVIEAASTKPFGFMPFYPGPGVGGHCIPVDPLYLAWEAQTRNKSARLLKLAHKINEEQPRRVAEHVVAAIQATRKSPRDARVLVCGVTYKPNTEDTRHSPADAVLNWLEKLGVGANTGLFWVDPYAHDWQQGRYNLHRAPACSVDGHNYDVAVVLVNHKFPGNQKTFGDMLVPMHISGCVIDACGALRDDIFFPHEVRSA